MSTEIKTLAATEHHAEDFARLTILANAQDKMFHYICPSDRNATLTQQSEHLRWRTERIRNRMQSVGTYWFRAVDVKMGVTVGIAGVIAPHCDKSGWTDESSDAVDKQAFEECAQMIAQKRQELLGDRGDVWYLASMAVHPDFRAQGIGSKLLAEICHLADASSQDVYLESTPVGLKLYQNTGFESLGIIFFEGEYCLTCMLRKADLAS